VISVENGHGIQIASDPLLAADSRQANPATSRGVRDAHPIGLLPAAGPDSRSYRQANATRLTRDRARRGRAAAREL